MARAWGLRERGEWPRGRTPHERRAHVQVEAQGLAKGRERAHLLERGRHLGERRRAWGPLEVRWRLWEGRTSHMRGPHHLSKVKTMVKCVSQLGRA